MADKIENTAQEWKEIGSAEIRHEMSAANVTPRMDNRVATDDNCAL